MHTILFDIDGTLINTGGAGGTALMKAFSETFQISSPATVPFSGRTDRGIGSELFERHGVADVPDNWARLRLAYLSELEVQLPRHPGRVLPGVLAILETLRNVSCHEDSMLQVGLLTGNVRDGAAAKLSYYGLLENFAFGGFGDEHRQRDDVAREAARAAQQRRPESFRSDRVWVVGDTTLDVRCARAIGARALAVATGGHPRTELEEESPDALFDDLSDTDAVLERLLGD